MQASRIRAALWGFVLGDALGLPVQFESREQRRRRPIEGPEGWGCFHVPPGTWSDDSSLLLCTLQALMTQPRNQAPDPAPFVRNALNWRFQGEFTPHHQAFDVGGTTEAALHRLANGEAGYLESGDRADHQNGNGSLMRMLPLAFLPASDNWPLNLEQTRVWSGITHAHPRAVFACQFHLDFTRNLLQGLSPLPAYEATCQLWQSQKKLWKREQTALNRLTSGRLASTPEKDISSSGYVIHTLEASLWCFLQGGGFQATVLRAINLGDDTDTVGAVCGGWAGLLYGEESLPPDWLKALQNFPLLERSISGFARWAGLEI